MTFKEVSVASRSLAFLAALCLAFPQPVSAMRQMTAEGTGPEELQNRIGAPQGGLEELKSLPEIYNEVTTWMDNQRIPRRASDVGVFDADKDIMLKLFQQMAEDLTAGQTTIPPYLQRRITDSFPFLTFHNQGVVQNFLHQVRADIPITVAQQVDDLMDSMRSFTPEEIQNGLVLFTARKTASFRVEERELSAAEKIEKAFLGWKPDFKDSFSVRLELALLLWAEICDHGALFEIPSSTLIMVRRSSGPLEEFRVPTT